MRIFTVVGARPNFIKIDPTLPQTIIHTGQHFDFKMSTNFFKELHLPIPAYNFGLSSEKTGAMIDALRVLFRKNKPAMVLVFGDTNSSMAGALAAAYENIRVAHIESGLRSYRRDMPEEINRVMIDHLATIKFCPNHIAQNNLFKEGIINNVHVVGDPSFDTFGRFLPIKRTKNYQKYILLTVHRSFNTDNKERMKVIFDAIKESREKFIFPVHPRTKKMRTKFKIDFPKNIKIIEPTTYREMLSLISNAKKVITDSGGIQREAYWMNTPVIILRTETEWTEIISKGAGILANNKEDILAAICNFKGKLNTPSQTESANKKIKEILFQYA